MEAIIQEQEEEKPLKSPLKENL